MKAESSVEIKTALKQLPAGKLIEIVLRLARFKKENKELLSYLLFSVDDQQGYIESIKKEIDEAFLELPKGSVYFTKKAMRKILRMISRQNRYMATKIAYAELLLHFCRCYASKKFSSSKNDALTKIFIQQLDKLESLIPELEEDLQFDFRKEVEKIRN